jgi:hypothetical protein
MTNFDFFTQDVDTLAAAIYGALEQCESDILDNIYVLTGIEIDRVTLSEELRIAAIKQELLKPYVPAEVDDGSA